MSDRYVINADNTVTKMDDLTEWAKRFETDQRRIARTAMPDGRIVSTVFLGLDHRYGDSHPPALFETMIFPSDKNFSEEWGERCATYSQALQQHERGIKEAQRLAEVSTSDTPATTYYRQPSASSPS